MKLRLQINDQTIFDGAAPSQLQHQVETLSDGIHLLKVTASDIAGNRTESVVVPLTIDTVVPTISQFDLALTSDSGTLGDFATRAARVTLTGVTKGNVFLTGSGVEGKVRSAGDGTFRIPNVSLAQGSNSFTVQAADLAGNTSERQQVFMRDAEVGVTDPVLRWNQAALEAIRLDATPPPIATRGLAMVSIAMLDVVNAIEGTPSYLVSLPAPAAGSLSMEAAISTAAFRVLSYLYPGQAAANQAVQTAALAEIQDGPAETNGIAFGTLVADAVVALRVRDGWNTFIDYVPGNLPGDWQPTGPMFDVALLPQWGQVTPFGINSVQAVTPDGPPALSSPEWAAAFNEVKSLGAATSSTRTADQTEIARFWADGSGTYTPPGHWNQIASQISQSQELSVGENARLFAMLNVALGDAGIVSWNAKYQTEFWRPVTAIRQADTDSNAATEADSAWSSFLITPPFPEYTSGHSTFSGAAAEILTAYFGDNQSFSTTSIGLPNVSRDFTSFNQAADEASLSRIYGGIHYKFSADDGMAAGRAIAQEVLDRFTVADDTRAPQVVFLSPPDASVQANNPNVQGWVIDNLAGVASAEVRIDGGIYAPLTLDANGRFQFQPTLALEGTAEGSHVLHIRALDKAGLQSGEFDFAFTLDTKAPTITLTAPIDSASVTATQRLEGSVSGTGSALVSLAYQIDDGARMPLSFIPAGGSFGQPLNLSLLAAGDHTLAVTARDSAGLETTSTVNFTLTSMIPLTVASHTPRSGASDVGSTFRPQVFFSRPIDPATLTASNFFATDTTGAKVPATIVPAQDGSFAWLFFANPLPGGSTITLHVNGETILASDGTKLDADGDGDGAGGGELIYRYTTVSLAPLLGTSLSGRVVDPGEDLKPVTFDDIRSGADGTLHTSDDVFLNPIKHAKVFILGLEDQFVFTDDNGFFSFASVPGGTIKLAIDGNTATNAPTGTYWPEMVVDLEMEVGRANTVMGTMGTRSQREENLDRTEVYLPRLQGSILTTLSSDQTTVITADAISTPDLTPEQRQYLTLEVQPQSALDSQGQPIPNARVGFSTVPPQLVREMLPEGLMQLSGTLTVQAPGVAAFSPPIKLTFPNIYNAAPGTQLPFYSYDHTTGRLVIEGTTTVSADGRYAVTDPNNGISHPGWFGPTPPGSNAGGGGQTGSDAGSPFGSGPGGGSGNGSGIRISGPIRHPQPTWRVPSPPTTPTPPAPPSSPPNPPPLPPVPPPSPISSSCRKLDYPQLDFLGNTIATATSLATIYNLPTCFLGETYSGNGVLKHGSSTQQGFDVDMLAIVAAPGDYLSVSATDIRGFYINGMTSSWINYAPTYLRLFNAQGQEVSRSTTSQTEYPPVPSPPPGIGQIPERGGRNKTTLQFRVPTSDIGNRTYYLGVTASNLLDNFSYDPRVDPLPGSFAILPQPLTDVAGEYRVNVVRTPFAAGESLDALIVDDETKDVPPDSYFQPRPLHIAIENLSTGLISRQYTDNSGQFSQFMAPETWFRIVAYDAKFNLADSALFYSGPSGGNIGLSQFGLGRLFSDDSDSDGLSDAAEFALGTSSQLVDSDGDGISDFEEIQQNLDPLEGRPLATGVVANLRVLGEAKEVVVEGSTLNGEEQTAYVATGSYGLAIVNVSQFQQPVLVSQLDLPGDAVDVAVDLRRGMAVVATGSAGLQLVDVSNSAFPALIRTINSNAGQVEVIEGIAYAAVGPAVSAFDLLTGDLMDSLSLGSGNIVSLARDGTTLFTIDSANQLRAVDLATGNMVTRGSLNMPVSGKLFVGGGIAYVAGEGSFNGGFATANVANLDSLTLLSGVDATNIVAKALAVNGSGLAIGVGSPANLGNLLHLLNVSDPTITNGFLTQFTLPADPQSVAIGAGIAYVADGTGGLQVVNYRAFDNQGQPPTVAISADTIDVDTVTLGFQVLEGTTIPIRATITDDVQVRSVELLVNGQVIRNDVSFPFDLSAIIPNITVGGTTATIQVRATDTGGNVGLSMPLVLDVVPDTFAPTVAAITPMDGAARGQTLRTVVVNFSESMLLGTLTADQVRLIGPNGPVLPLNVQVRNQEQSVQFTYDALAIGEYELVIQADAITDRAGNKLGANDITSNFTIVHASSIWTNPAGGFWDVASNWNTGVVPGVDDDVLIDVPGTPTITIRSGSAEVKTLRSEEAIVVSGGTLSISSASTVSGDVLLSGGELSGAGDLTVTGVLSWTFGTMSGTGKTTISAGATLNMSAMRNGGDKFLNRVLQNDGGATWTGGEWRMNGGTFQNNGSFTANSDFALLAWGDGGTNVFENAGTFVKQGTGTTQFRVNKTSVAFNNSGTVDVQAGTLSLVSGGTHSGDFTAPTGATLEIGGNHTFAVGADISGNGSFVSSSGTSSYPGSLTTAGDLTVSGGALTIAGVLNAGTALITGGGGLTVTGDVIVTTLDVSGTVVLNSMISATNGTFSGGTLSGTGDVTYSGTLDWTGGTMSGTGRTIIPAGATLNLTKTPRLNRVLENNGTATWTGGGLGMNGGTFKNNGTFTANTKYLATA